MMQDWLLTLHKLQHRHNGVLLNYFPVTGLLKANKKICGVRVKDVFTGKEYEIKSKAVINATGVFTDAVMNMDDPKHKQYDHPQPGNSFGG